MADVTRNHAVTTTGFTHTPETIFAGTRYKHETVYGTENTPTGQGFSKFYGVSVTPTIQQDTKNVEVQGITLATGVLKGAEYSTWEGSGSCAFADFGIIVDINSSGPQQPNSYTLQHFDLKSTGCAVKSYGISGSPLELNMDLGFVGKKVTKGIATPTNDVTPEGQSVFFEPTNTKIYIDDHLVERVNAFSLSVDGIWDIGNFIDNDKQTILQTRVNGEFTITEPMVNTQTYSVWKGDGVQTVKIVNKTDIGTTRYWFTIEFKVMWQTPDSPGDTDNMWTVQNKATIIHDENQPALNVHSGIDESPFDASDAPVVPESTGGSEEPADPEDTEGSGT